MPYVLKHTKTSQIATASLMNVYQLPYYGVKYWDHKEDAERDKEAFLRSQGFNDPAMWETVEIDDNLLKLYNVKLKNDPTRHLFADDQLKPIVKPKHS